MFGFFKITPRPNYNLFNTEIDKYRHLINWIKISLDKHMLVYHFDNTQNEAEQLLKAAQLEYSKDINSGSKVLLIDAESLLKGSWPLDYWVIVLEIYPVTNREQTLMQRAKEHSHSLEFYAAIDSPFFKLFGGEQHAAFIQKNNADKDEAMSHPLINRAIVKSQKKVEDKLQLEVTERESIEQWIQVNGIDRE
ncbi:hypothetical protein [Fulvivirga lutimaris]|uniref:hypothetical protein n=1 Tax=Fulvivirga lutimaris TaxID=1819566 RepID=UPI0012BBDF97|nr:hypothetical protein [Fulvivirga lutimaris]MTI41652.1 hypothetical protein [Fulvivirga lutimaris]